MPKLVDTQINDRRPMSFRGLPSADTLNLLKIEDHVKVGFIHPDNPMFIEWVWAEVRVLGKPMTCRVDNHIQMVPDVNCDDLVDIEHQHIVDILTDVPY